MYARSFWVACLLAFNGVSEAAPVEIFRFWPGPGVKSVPGFQELSEHPCGEVAIAAVSKLPTAERGPLLPEIVVELNNNGRVIRRWPMPVDYAPSALLGDELLVQSGKEFFWIRPNGAFRRATSTPSSNETIDTCDVTKVFGKSDYSQCRRLVDLVSRKIRTIGYEGVCS